MNVAPRQTGSFVSSTTTGERIEAFVPYPLPPSDPPISETDHRLVAGLMEAETSLRELRVATHLVLDMKWLQFAFVRQEAVLSSQIEGTQATITDLLETEAWATGETPDVAEVTNYIRALEYARAQLRSAKGLPLSLRLLCATHEKLLRGVRGMHKSPGAFRSSQNWIGGTRPENAQFVPPPPKEMHQCLSALETYLHIAHDTQTLSPLARIGLVHAQFETIHPFLDGNGRLGRLLMTLLFEEWGLLNAPILYLSVFFKTHQQEYYRRLNAVRTEGDWESWLVFFFTGVTQTSQQVIDLATKLQAQWQKDQRCVEDARGVTVAAIRLMRCLPTMPIISASLVGEKLGITFPTAKKAIRQLLAARIIRPAEQHGREQFYHYDRYISILNAGMTLPA